MSYLSRIVDGMYVYYYLGGVDVRSITSSLNTVFILKRMNEMKSSRAVSEVFVCGYKGAMLQIVSTVAMIGYALYLVVGIVLEVGTWEYGGSTGPGCGGTCK